MNYLADYYNNLTKPGSLVIVCTQFNQGNAGNETSKHSAKPKIFIQQLDVC